MMGMFWKIKEGRSPFLKRKKIVFCDCHTELHPCSRHFFLLTKESPSGKVTPLGAMFSLLTSPGVGRPVSAVILKAVESLLEGEEDHEEEPPQKKRRIGWLISGIVGFFFGY